MSGEDTPFPPSEQKLRRLRDEGQLPRSEELNLFGAFAGMFLAAGVIAKSGGPALEELAREGFSTVMLSPAGFAGVTMKLAIPSIVFIAAGALLLQGLQNRFFFRPQLVGFNLGRLFQGWSSVLRVGSRLSMFAGSLALTLIWSAVGWVLLRTAHERFRDVFARGLAPAGGDQAALTDLAAKLAAELSDVLGIFVQLFATAFAAILGTAFLIGAVSRFVHVLRFRREHGMTRAEVEAENRETELSPDIRRRIGELHESE